MPDQPRSSRTFPGDLELGRLGMGVAPLGNLYSEVTEADAGHTLASAARLGIRWYDVAPLYGLGLAEERLGRFLQHSPASSGRRVVSTKVGRILEPVRDAPAHEQFVAALPNWARFDYSRAGIQKSYADSLRRLRVERVEMLLLHDIDRFTHPETHRAVVKQALDEALPALHSLKAQGRVDAIGLGINQWDVGYEILASADIDCVLLAGRYTLLDQTAFTSGFLDACQRRNVAVLAGGVLNSGLLAGGGTYDYRPASPTLLQQRDQLAVICSRYDVPLPAAALQFTSAHPAVTSVVVGARSAQEVEAIVDWGSRRIPSDLWRELNACGALPPDVPAPRQLEGT